MPSENTSKYWFRAKRYGWGGGLPRAWQGWVVLFAYFALVLGGIPLLQATQGSIVYLAYVFALSVALMGICWLTGEPARWRWGDRDA